MQVSIIWLARLGVDQGMFSAKSAWAVRLKLGEDVELLDYAQELIDGGHVPHDLIEELEKLAGQAFARAKSGPPENDPFDTPVTNSPFAGTAGAGGSRPATLSHSASAQSTSSGSGAGRAGAIKISDDLNFAQVAKLSDSELAAGLRQLLVKSAATGVSDLHISAGSTPFVRRERVLEPISAHVLTPEESMRLNIALLAPHQRATFTELKDLDYALALEGGGRFRVNLMVHKGGAAGSYRMVAAKIPKLGDLGLRNIEAVRKLLTYHNGLILVTGPVGSGKTTTLAALVSEINDTRSDHVITVEDPIEVVQVARGCNITQREVGPHTKSFATALKGALREDPDVIVIGELRDLETIEMAISASETGHLVIGTMHTSDAATTLNRLLDVFPPAQQAQIRASVAESLRGVVCQRLLPAAGGGLALACEILVGNPAVAALIREGKTSGLRNVIETGQREGMCLMETGVFSLWSEGRISAATARENIANRTLRARIAG